MKLDIIFEKQKEGGYTAYVPALPGCISEGNTKAESMKNIREAISLYLEEINRSTLKELVKSISVEKAAERLFGN